MNKKNICIIGAGPAGIIAAIMASENYNVDVYETGIPLKTLLYTGNGRCNLTNNLFDFKELCENYPRGKKFLYSAFARFGVEQTLSFFKSIGLECYTQSDNRIFPVSNKAAEVRERLLLTAKKQNINLITKTQIANLSEKDGNFVIKAGNHEKIYQKAVIATGGNSRFDNNMGYKIAIEFGHSIIPVKPALTGYILAEKWVKELAGVSLKDIKLTAFSNNKKTSSIVGDIIFTHKGITGPAVFKTSSYNAYQEISNKTPLLLELCLLPENLSENFEQILLKDFKENSNKSIINILKNYIPKSLAIALCTTTKIDPEKKVSIINKIERKTIVEFCTALKLNALSTVQDGEIVTAGGVNLKEINPATMESKKQKGLYFCGEVLDIDGLTGGFNLQACWSTGYVAGTSI